MLDAFNVVEEDLEVAAHLLGRLGAPHGAGHLVPEVGGAHTIVGERLLEHLVLFLGSLRVGAWGGAPRRRPGRHLQVRCDVLLVLMLAFVCLVCWGVSLAALGEALGVWLVSLLLRGLLFIGDGGVSCLSVG